MFSYIGFHVTCKFQVLKCISQLELAQLIGTGVKAPNSPGVSGSSAQCNHTFSTQYIFEDCRISYLTATFFQMYWRAQPTWMKECYIVCKNAWVKQLHRVLLLLLIGNSICHYLRGFVYVMFLWEFTKWFAWKWTHNFQNFSRIFKIGRWCRCAFCPSTVWSF